MPISVEHARALQERLAVHAERPRTLLLGVAAGISPIVLLAERLRAMADARWKPLVLFGSDGTFPFRPRPSAIIVAGMPPGCIACMPALEGLGIASRLASRADLPGCFDGAVTELADLWLRTLGPGEISELEIVACGPAGMGVAAGELARRHRVPYQTVPSEDDASPNTAT